MRRTKVYCAAIVALLCATAQAQDQTEYELQHQMAETERQAIIADDMPLLESEEEAFWKLYLEYRAAAKEMDDKRTSLLRRYAGSFEDLDAKQGTRLVTDALRLEERRQLLKKRYLKKFARILPGKRLFRYYQIETKLDAMLRYSWTRQVPLAPVSE